MNPGTVIGPYKVLSLLSQGGMGKVYRAHHARLGRDVALKVLPREFAANADRLRRFEQEARTLAGLDHQNLIVIHDTGVHEGEPYLVSELLVGRTLREALSEGPPPVRRAVEWAVQIAQGLAAAHSKGVVHRDLKPENLFLTKEKGDEISYNRFLLPLSRIVKAYSMLMNRFGKAAPIPEGMSATTALRTQDYMGKHDAIGKRLEKRAEQSVERSREAKAFLLK